MHVLAQWHMIGYRLFVSEPIGNDFYMHAAMFEIPVAFYKKTLLANSRMFQ